MTELETKSKNDNKVEKEDTEEWHWFPKVIREVKDIDEDSVEVCPSFVWLNRKRHLKCKKIKRKKR